MRVADLIASRRDVYSIPEGTTVHDAARYLRDKEVRAVGVCDKQGVLLGVVSQSDVSDKVAAENKCPAWMHVSEIMTRQLVSATPDTSLEHCLRLMEQHEFLSRGARSRKGISRNDLGDGPLAAIRVGSKGSC